MRSRPWSAYALRILCSGLFFASAYALLTGSTFAMRMRGDVPIQIIVLAVAGALTVLPLLFGRRYLGALLVCGFIVSGIGAYWWTTIPWDEFIKDSGFPTDSAPRLMDYALVASPAIIAGFYAAVSRSSLLRADLKNRGADADEIRRATSVSFLSGATLLVFCGLLAGLLWALMASGIAFAAIAPIPTGIPALVMVAALAAVAWAILTGRVPRLRGRGPTRKHAPGAAARPSSGEMKGRAADPNGLAARWRARDSRDVG